MFSQHFGPQHVVVHIFCLSFKATLNLILSEVSTAVIALLHSLMPLRAYRILNYHINLHS